MRKFITKWLKILEHKGRELLALCSVFLIKKLSEFELFITRCFESQNPNGYEDLTPTSNGDKDKKYSEALGWALKNKKIKNIAITGAYGSGKSSIIRTFEKENQGYNYLNISLASFTDNPEMNSDNSSDEKATDNDSSSDENKVDSKNISNRNIDRLIELSILQQMFYHVKHKKIPDSRFKRIKGIHSWKLICRALGTIIWILSLLVFLKPKFIQETKIWEQLNLSNHGSIVSFILLGIVLFGIWVIISKSIRIANNSKLNKLNVQSGEIEISKDIDSSILNKHLDEILYFFEVTKYNVVIIEDLDRFNNPDIFTKLRELNILINNSRQINRRIVFLYAIKDDMFKDKNRTKFFDFVLPVIPLINKSNSGDRFVNKLKENNLVGTENDLLSEDFICDVSMYIEDMRLLKNVYNEYITYKRNLESFTLNQNNLFAIILYKNIFPSDFVDLHNDKGKVCTIFNKKQNTIKELINLIDIEISENRKKIKDIEAVSVKDIQELRAIYISAIIERLPSIDKFRIEGNEYNFSQIKQDDNFEKLIDLNNINYYSFQYYNGRYYNRADATSNFSFKDIENSIDSNKTYQEREQLILDKVNGKIEQLKKKNEDLKKEKNEIKFMSLQQLSEKIDVADLFQEIKDDELIIYLIRNGYINEDYHYYISYFHEGLITKDDRKFLFSIKNQEPLSFTFQLTKIENLIKKIKNKEFETKSALNVYLLDYVLTQQKYNEQCTAIFKQIWNKSKVSTAFIDSFIENGIHTDIFIVSICKQWKSFGNFIFWESEYSEETKDKYLKLITAYVDIDTIKGLNANSAISKYLATKRNFVNVFANEENIKKVIKELNIKFENLEQPESENKLLNFIYENNLYEINQEMISLFFTVKSGNNDNLNIANYTTIKTSACSQLIKYIDSNLEQYISKVFLAMPENTEESEEYVVELLKKGSEIILDDRTEIIKKQNCIISNLATVDNVEHSLLEIIVQESKMTPTWENVLCYYKIKDSEIDNSLVQFLDQKENYKELSKTKLSTEDEAVLFSNSLITDLDISYESYESLLPCCPYVYEELDFDCLDEDKVKLMIKLGYLELSVERFEYLKENFALHTDLLEKYPEKFIENQEYTLDAEDIFILLNSSSFTQEQKVSIIQNTADDLIIGDVRLSYVICYILSEYQYVDLDFDVLQSLIKTGDNTGKLKLFNLHIPHLSDSQISTLLNLFDTPYSDIATKGKQPSLENNQYNLQLANELQRKGYISTFSEKDDKIKINTKRI